MNCSEARRLLQPYSDGELELERHVQVEEHLADCACCAQQEKNLGALRTTVASPELYHRAPAALRARLASAAAEPVPARAAWRPSLHRLGLAAGVLFLMASSALIGRFFPRAGGSSDEQLAQSVVADHVRSLQVDHLTDVASTDRHTVKPWFRGKLDFAPQVPDLAAEGYPLTGGRLDYLAGHPAAALVYMRRLHAINVFTWPAATRVERPVARREQQGFHIRQWQRNGMNYWAISDLNDQELDAFVRLFQEHALDAPPAVESAPTPGPR